MADDRWHAVDAAFEAALGLEGAARDEMLRQITDPEKRRAVERLLALEPEAGRALSGADALRLAGSETFDEVVAEGSHIGPYRIRRLLGQGGMGRVYLAERADEEFQRRVAIKISQPLMSQELKQRFLAERQILADLDHPNIARLLDGGTTDSGLPYLVMDYIEGTTIDAYCDQHALPQIARIELFETVCSAVQHAHRMLVVHRDLKPSNILIAEDGTPKLLDFGIAKLLSVDERSRTGADLTRDGRVPLTPNYASPEQWRGEPLTTATDVYSLGVLLYQLLTGRLPRSLDSVPPSDIDSALRDLEPAAPGLNRDLDRVLLRALATEPQQRYGTVDAFADDLRRYRFGLPVRARSQTLGYRAGKLLHRHRVAAAALLTGMLALTGFAIDRAQQARRLAEERDVSRAEATKAEELSEFLTDLLQQADPWHTGGPEPSVRQVLERGVGDIDRRFTDQDAIRGALLDTMGVSYMNLGRYDEAAELLEQGLHVRRRVLSAEDPDLALSLINIGAVYLRRGEYERTRAPLEEAIISLRRSGASPERLAMALSLSSMRLSFLGELEAAEVRARESLEQNETYDASPLDVASHEHQLAAVLLETGSFEEAEQRLSAVLTTLIAEFGEDNPRTTQAQIRLASIRRRLGDLEGTERLLRDALASRRKVFDEDHMQVGQVKNDLAAVLSMRGSLAESEKLYREVLVAAEKRLGKNHRDMAVLHNNIGALMLDKGDLGGARRHLRRSLEILRRSLPPGHPGAAHPMVRLARVEMAAEAPNVAEALFREALALRLTNMPENHPLVVEIRYFLGTCLLTTGRSTEAEELLLSAFALLDDPGNRVFAVRAGERLAQHFRQRGDNQRALDIEARLRESPLSPDEDTGSPGLTSSFAVLR